MWRNFTTLAIFLKSCHFWVFSYVKILNRIWQLFLFLAHGKQTTADIASKYPYRCFAYDWTTFCYVTRSILPTCSIHEIRGSRKTSCDSLANKNISLLQISKGWVANPTHRAKRLDKCASEASLAFKYKHQRQIITVKIKKVLTVGMGMQ